MMCDAACITHKMTRLRSMHPQDEFQSAAKELTEAVAQQEEENLVLAFATAADTDFLAYVYAQVVLHMTATGLCQSSWSSVVTSALQTLVL
jgi:hypothetical protein